MSNPPQGNWFIRLCSKPARGLGFNKIYNFPLWVIFGGALLGFSLARLHYLAIDTKFKDGSAPGEWYWFRKAPYKGAMVAHLATILPACMLAVFQFVPVIRHKFILIHKIDGYIIIILTLATVGTALVMARHSFGGTVETQGAVYFLAVITTGAILMAYYNIKKLQIDQHRAWMLRTFIYMGSIITTRIIMAISASIIGKIGSYFALFRCDELRFTDEGLYNLAYRQLCAVSGPNGVVPVPALFGTDNETTATVGAAFRVTFGMSLWLALGLHILGVEIYFHLTPAESARLRQASYERQVAAGMRNPGSAGLTSDKFGDAYWEPARRESEDQTQNGKLQQADSNSDSGSAANIIPTQNRRDVEMGR